MIRNAKNYTKRNKAKQNKKNIKTDRQSPRTNGKSKAIQTNSHKEAYTYPFREREKGRKYIYLDIKI